MANKNRQIAPDTFRIVYQLDSIITKDMGVVNSTIKIMSPNYFSDTISNNYQMIIIASDTMIHKGGKYFGILAYTLNNWGAEPDVLNLFINYQDSLYRMSSLLKKNPVGRDTVDISSNAKNPEVRNILVNYWRNIVSRNYSYNGLDINIIYTLDRVHFEEMQINKRHH